MFNDSLQKVNKINFQDYSKNLRFACPFVWDLLWDLLWDLSWD